MAIGDVTISADQYAALTNKTPNTATSTLGGGLLNALGGYLGGQSATNAANTAAQQQFGAAAGAQFRPVGITSRFGQSGYNYDANGRLIGAGYQAAPDVAAMREGAIQQAGGYLGQAGQGAMATAPASQAVQSLFNLGNQYLATSPQQAAQDYMASQQALLQPSRDYSFGQLQQNLQNTGRAGLSVAQGGNLGSANPEAQAYYNALAQQNAQLAAQSMQQGQQATQFGAGLIGTGLNTLSGTYGAQTAAYSPYTTAFGAATGLENQAAAPMAVSQALGTAGADAGYKAGVLSNIGTASQAQANAYNPWQSVLQGAASNPQVVSGLGGLFGSWLS